MSDRNKRRAGGRKRTLEDLLAELPPPTWEEIQAWRKFWRRKANVGAAVQVRRAIPPGDSSKSLALLLTFVPSDGVESALSRLIVAATNGAMDCFARAAALDTPGRLIELNLGAKLTLTVATLTKALDDHGLRAKDLPIFVDDTVKPVRRRGLGTTNLGAEPGDKAPSSSEECAASNDEPKHAKK